LFVVFVDKLKKEKKKTKMNKDLDVPLNVLIILTQIIIVVFCMIVIIYNYMKLSKRNSPSVVDVMLRTILYYLIWEVVFVVWDGYTEFHPNKDIRDALHIPLLILVVVNACASLVCIVGLAVAEKTKSSKDPVHKEHLKSYLSQFVLIEGEAFKSLRLNLWVVLIINLAQLPAYMLDRYCAENNWFTSISMFNVVMGVFCIPQGIYISIFDSWNYRRPISVPRPEKAIKIHDGDIPHSDNDD
jgi:hypothetical protein